MGTFNQSLKVITLLLQLQFTALIFDGDIFYLQAREGVGLMETGNEGEKDSATPERLSVFARVLGEYSTVHVNIKVQ